MNKSVKYTYGGMNQDISKSKHSPKYYFEGQHIRILASNSQSTGNVTNEKGNELVITIPSIDINIATKRINIGDTYITYINDEINDQVANGMPTFSDSQKIIGTIDTREGIVIFTSDDLGMDCVWIVEELLKEDYSIRLLYLRNLNFSISHPIQAIFNYENEIIQKIYWVDGVNQIRFLNIYHSIENGDLEELIDVNSNTINFVGNFQLNQPQIEDILSGGTHTSGVIQYAYNLYRLNSSQTTISPLSVLVALDKGDTLGGGEVNEVVGATPIVKISNIDTEYTHIRIYAIKYTSYNQQPEVSIIADREVGETNEIIYFDDGAIIENLSLEEFLFLGSDPIIPKHIEVKDNSLFSANITAKAFDVELDCRAYGYLESSVTSYVLNNVTSIPGSLGIPNSVPGVGGDFLLVPTDFDIPEKFDAVTPNYDAYAYNRLSTTRGGTGKNITYELTPTLKTDITEDELKDGRFFKSKEIYRIGIQFYNRLGQKSFPKWIADFKSPVGNLTDSVNTLTVTLTADFYVWLNTSSNFESEDDKPIGYKIIRAERTLNDRSVLYQGILSSMLFQVKGDDAENYTQFPEDAVDFQDNQLKFPTYLVRNFDNTLELSPELSGVPVGAAPNYIQKVQHLGWISDRDNGFQEVHSQVDHNNKISQTFQHTKILQLHSPDLLFDFATVRTGLKVKINGMVNRTKELVESQETFIATNLEKNGGKFEFFPVRHFIENNSMSSTFKTPSAGYPSRFIGPSGDSETTDYYQYYREYHTFNIINSVDGDVEHPIYGKPEISGTGADERDYNGDGRYRYANTLQSFISDGEDDCSDGNCDPISSINSFAVKTLTFLLGTNSTSTTSRVGLEQLRNFKSIVNNGITGGQGLLSVDITIPKINLYLGNLYGGGSYESKKRSAYIEIGSYQDINTDVNFIISPGDTFINNYKFMRIGKTNTQVLDTQIPQFTEIVSFPVETVVDLKNRNDLSLYGWDNRFQPQFAEYFKYNRVYSQEAKLIENVGEGFKFKKVKSFDTRIVASKVKIPGEDIDSWTDLLINEVQDLDGKYGPINSLVSFKDNLFVWQDEAIASLSVNPIVQVQAGDGINLELGTGKVLNDYTYITTTSGSINKWSVVPTKKGIYYYDALNKSVGRAPDFINVSLSDAKGMHAWFNEYYDYSKIKEDNPLLKTGVLLGYDNYNNDIYITLHQDSEDSENPLSFTRCYNELIDEFIDKKSYLPTGYIYKGEKLLLVHGDNTKMYEHFKGEYNKYFEEYTPSYITLMLNPEADYSCVFDTIQYNSELYLNDIDQPEKTLTHIQAYDEYQNSGRIPLIIGRDKNLRRKFREWRASIPRVGRNRMRNPYIFLKLELDNNSNYKLILHDVIVNYTL